MSPVAYTIFHLFICSENIFFSSRFLFVVLSVMFECYKTIFSLKSCQKIFSCKLFLYLVNIILSFNPVLKEEIHFGPRWTVLTKKVWIFLFKFRQIYIFLTYLVPYSHSNFSRFYLQRSDYHRFTFLYSKAIVK